MKSKMSANGSAEPGRPVRSTEFKYSFGTNHSGDKRLQWLRVELREALGVRLGPLWMRRSRSPVGRIRRLAAIVTSDGQRGDSATA